MSSSQKVVDGFHYEYHLPIREGCSQANTKYLAIQRLKSPRKKLLTNPDFLQDYQHFMQRLQEDRHAEEAPDVELDTDVNTWYLPPMAFTILEHHLR